MDKRLEGIKQYPRAMRFYVLMMYEIIRESKPTKVLEIGVQNAQSSKTMLMAMGLNNHGTLVSIDHKNRSEVLDAEFSDLKERWKFIKGDSHAPESVQAAKDHLEEGELYDMLFIDGDHSYEGAKQDFVEYSELVKPGGVVMLHDTVNTDQGVNKLWAEIDWPEKFNLDWGNARARANLIVGFGLTRKPL